MFRARIQCLLFLSFSQGCRFCRFPTNGSFFSRFFVVVRRVFFAFFALSLFVAFVKILSLFGQKTAILSLFFVFINDGFHIFTLLVLLSCLYIAFCVKLICVCVLFSLSIVSDSAVSQWVSSQWSVTDDYLPRARVSAVYMYGVTLY